MSHRRYIFTGIGSLFIAFSLSAALVADQADSSASAAQGRDARLRDASCEADGPSLQIVIVDTTHVAATSLNIAGQEAARIWAGAGLCLVWTSPPHAEGSSTCPLLVVLVRPTLTRSGQHQTDVRRRGTMPLGWILLDEHGDPGNTIEVSLTSITSLVMSASYVGHSVSAVPQYVQDELVGRAIGRVIAHEIGHWLFGPSHDSDGLMSVVLDGQALVNPQLPAIRREWETIVTEQLRCGAHYLDLRVFPLPATVSNSRPYEKSGPRA